MDSDLNNNYNVFSFSIQSSLGYRLNFERDVFYQRTFQHRIKVVLIHSIQKGEINLWAWIFVPSFEEVSSVCPWMKREGWLDLPFFFRGGGGSQNWDLRR